MVSAYLSVSSGEGQEGLPEGAGVEIFNKLLRLSRLGNPRRLLEGQPGGEFSTKLWRCFESGP